jgi:uncharacterized membrane protein YhaH (DUF805 family)
MFRYVGLIGKAFKNVFPDMFKLTTRLGKYSFIFTILALMVIFFNIVTLLNYAMSWFGFPETVATDIVNGLNFLLISIVFIMSIRRVHDVGFTAWLLMLGFMHPVFIPFLVILVLWKGDPNVNKYGAPVEDLNLDEFLERDEEY